MGELMLTAPSSAEILPFQVNQPINRKGSFEAWRENWVRTVIADSNLWNCDKSVAVFLSFHLNRETHACFPSYATIGKGVGIDRLNARRSIKRLIARGYLIREQRGKGQSNLYFPTGADVVADDHTPTRKVWSHTTTGAAEEVWSYTTTGVVADDHSGVVADDHLTSESLTSDLTLGSSEEKKAGLPRPKEKKEEKEAKPSKEVWVKYDTPEWDRVERFGHRATGKVFIRYGRVDGAWILKSDLKAIEALAATNGGGQ